MSLNRMMMDETDPSREALKALADCIMKRYVLNDIEMTGGSFKASASPSIEELPGVNSISAKIMNEKNILILFEILSTDKYLMDMAILKHLSDISREVKLFKNFKLLWGTQKDDAGIRTLCVEFLFEARPVTPSTISLIYEDLSVIEAGAAGIKKEFPKKVKKKIDFNKIFGEAFQYIEPVTPDMQIHCIDKNISEWSQSVIDYLKCGTAVAIDLNYAADEDLAINAIAAEGGEYGYYFGVLNTIIGGAKALAEINKTIKSDGVLIVRATQLNIGINPYEKTELMTVMNYLESIGRPITFIGRAAELTSAFGSQGMTCTPLKPVLAHFPEINHDINVKYIMNKFDGLSATEKSEAESIIINELDKLHISERKNIVYQICRMSHNEKISSNKSSFNSETIKKHINKLLGTTECISALTNSYKLKRPAHIHKNYIEQISSDKIFDHLFDRVYGQNTAIRNLVSKLRSEILRPGNEPMRLMMQGPPGCGKSSAAEALAEYLGAHYAMLDASSLSDPYSLKSQLFGGAVGLVNSYKIGMLEAFSKHHTGVVFEIMDADSCNNLVKSEVFSSMMNVLSGTISNSNGSIYSSASIIFIFTINTSKSVSVYSNDDQIGYVKGGFDQKIIESTLNKEIKTFASEAFLSRLGRIVYFRPIDSDAIREITETSIYKTILTAAENFSIRYKELSVEREAIDLIYGTLKDDNVLKMGARTIHECVREAVSTAINEQLNKLKNKNIKKLTLGLNHKNEIIIL